MSRWQRSSAVDRLRASASAHTQIPAVAHELLGALRSWKGQCEAGGVSLADGDPDALERALAAREALRPQIRELTGRLRAAGPIPAALRDEIARLGQEVAEADAGLVRGMEAERVRLRGEIDGLRRGPAPASGYRRPDEPNPHRLNIVR